MYAKYKVQELLETFAPLVIKALHMENWVIKFHIDNSKKHKIPLEDADDLVGLCFTAAHQSSEIIIYHDLVRSEEDAKATIVHELLHARFSEITNLVTLHQDLAHVAEEELVLDIERLFVQCIRGKIK